MRGGFSIGLWVGICDWGGAVSGIGMGRQWGGTIGVGWFSELAWGDNGGGTIVEGVWNWRLWENWRGGSNVRGETIGEGNLRFGEVILTKNI